MAEQRVKVPVSKLLEVVRKARQARVDEHAKATKAFDADMAKYRKAVAKAFRDAAKVIDEGGDVPKNRYGDLGVKLSEDINRPYVSSLDLSGFDKDIKLLEMTSDEVIPVSVESKWARYL